MRIRKRNGEMVEFSPEKIKNAMAKAFAGQKQEIDGEGLTKLLQAVLSRLSQDDVLTVELVQDEVERVLMESGWYDVAKAYILYREKQSVLRRVRASIVQAVGGDEDLDALLRRIQKDFGEESYSLTALQTKFDSFAKPSMSDTERCAALVKAAVELTTPEAPKWEFIAARLLNHCFRRNLACELSARGIACLYDKLRYDEEVGYPEAGIAPVTKWEEVPEDFECPLCSVGKELFEASEEGEQ